MEASLESLLVKMEKYSKKNDGSAKDISNCMLNITRDTGEFLAVLVRATAARRILEIGTSNGYSTLWLADAVRSCGGEVTTVDFSAKKVDLAANNFALAKLDSFIVQLRGDAGEVLSELGDSAFDMVFLDSDRGKYTQWWPNVRRVLRRGGLLVVDNAITHQKEMARFVRMVRADPELVTSIVPVGNGELLAARACKP
jgi:predicted O-methyltransferase YrrM